MRERVAMPDEVGGGVGLSLWAAARRGAAPGEPPPLQISRTPPGCSTPNSCPAPGNTFPVPVDSQVPQGHQDGIDEACGEEVRAEGTWHGESGPQGNHRDLPSMRAEKMGRTPLEVEQPMNERECLAGKTLDEYLGVSHH